MSWEYYDRQGNAITRDEWGKLLTEDYRQVAFDTLDGGSQVSTVWLGLDHSWGDEGPPLIFETMVFGGPCDGDQERYSTEADAVQGHAAVVASVKEREAEHNRIEKLRDAAPRLADQLAAWRAWAEKWGRDIETSVSVSPITHDELVERLAGTGAALREAGVE